MDSEVFRPEFRDTINRLLSGLPVPDPIFEEEIISDRLISHLSHAIRQVLLDRIQVLGDVFDRGPQPDKIFGFFLHTSIATESIMSSAIMISSGWAPPPATARLSPRHCVSPAATITSTFSTGCVLIPLTRRFCRTYLSG